MKPEEICVVIPGYNEAKRISKIASTVKDLGFRVLVVDDGSSDGMARKAIEVGVEVLSYTPNQGKGAALRRGIAWVLERSEIKAAIFMDSDGQHDSADLPLLVKSLKESSADFVIGNRMHNPEGMPLIRRLTNRFMSAVLSWVSGRSVPDTQCGYRAARSASLAKIYLETSRFEIESEMILEAGRIKAEVISVPIRSVYEGSKSYIHPIRDTGRFFSFLFKYIFTRRKRNNFRNSS